MEMNGALFLSIRHGISISFQVFMGLVISGSRQTCANPINFAVVLLVVVSKNERMAKASAFRGITVPEPETFHLHYGAYFDDALIIHNMV